MTAPDSLRARMTQMLVVLEDSGDITPMGVRQIERVLDAEGFPRASTQQ